MFEFFENPFLENRFRVILNWILSLSSARKRKKKHQSKLDGARIGDADEKLCAELRTQL